MVHTVFDYLKYDCDDDFYERPFCLADCLILCQLSYLKYDGIVPGIYEDKPSVTLKDICSDKRVDQLYTDKLFEKENRKLLLLASKCKRFRKIRLNMYMNICRKQEGIQFGAVLFLLPGTFPFVAFRGTDETILGWEEDFKMAYGEKIPSQSMSVRYLNFVAKKMAGPFRVGGHSKGGNLAVYGGVRCKKETQKRIVQIFSLDGPGFRREIIDKEEIVQIKEKVELIRPQYSTVGRLFTQGMQCKSIKSFGMGFMQHDLYTWLIKNRELFLIGKCKEKREIVSLGITGWMDKTTEKHRKLLLEVICQMFYRMGYEDLNAFTVDDKKCILNLFGTLFVAIQKSPVILRETVLKLLEETGEAMCLRNILQKKG